MSSAQKTDHKGKCQKSVKVPRNEIPPPKSIEKGQTTCQNKCPQISELMRHFSPLWLDFLKNTGKHRTFTHGHRSSDNSSAPARNGPNDGFCSFGAPCHAMRRAAAPGRSGAQNLAATERLDRHYARNVIVNFFFIAFFDFKCSVLNFKNRRSITEPSMSADASYSQSALERARAVQVST